MKRAVIRLVLLGVATLSLPSAACINAVGTNQKGERIEPMSHAGEALKPSLDKHVTLPYLVDWSNIAVKAAGEDPSFNNLNNLAAVLIYHGRHAKAVSLLQFLERKFPGRYETASNIGTAYELMGRNDDALKWILEGMKRNPSDHAGTEWLHAHILKAKLGRLPAPVSGRSILNMNFGSAAMPVRPTPLPLDNEGKQVSLYLAAHSLRYQLIERIQFVPAPEPMVAGLLVDWANLELFGGAVESATVLYDAAIRYGSKDPMIPMRKAQVLKILAQSKGEPPDGSGACEICFPPGMKDGKR